MVDARENQKALIALAQCNQSCAPQPQITNSLNTEKVSSSTNIYILMNIEKNEQHNLIYLRNTTWKSTNREI